MRQMTVDQLPRLLADHEPPCVSLYQPTHRRHPENQQDRIRYGNILKEMEKSLQAKYRSREVSSLLENFKALAYDELFWDHRTDGLAILASADCFELFELQRPVAQLVVVANSFHVKPLLRAVEAADRFQVLCLNRQEVRLYEGNRDALDPVDLKDVPATITEALGEELTEPHLTVASYGSGAGQAMVHGHGSTADEVDGDRDRFFRVGDRAILKHHSRPSGLPLVLGALAEYHTAFRRVSKNPFLVADGIRKNPDSLSVDELRREAWRVLEPTYAQRLEGLIERFQAACARQSGSDDLCDVARAAVAGRIATLLVEDERRIPGHVDPATGAIRLGDLAHPEVDDVLDDLAEMVLRMKGEVTVVPADKMPSESGLAAIYRY